MYATLTPKVHEALLTHARAEAPREAVGLILGRFEPMDYTRLTCDDHLLLTNTSADPKSHFMIEGCSLSLLLTVKESRQGRSFVALWHSHPTGRPLISHEDCHVLDQSRVPMLILGLQPKPEYRLYSLGRPRPNGQRPIHEIPLVIQEGAA